MIRNTSLKSLLPIIAIILMSCSLKPDITIANFENGTFEGWTVNGNAFGTAPVTGAIDDQQEISRFAGKYLANSFHGGDNATGSIESTEFTIKRNYINFLIGGGKRPGTYIELIIDGKSIIKSHSISESETLEWGTWDVKAYKGQNAKIKIVDNQVGDWGHILVDEIMMSDKDQSNILIKHELSFNISKKYLLIPIEDQAEANIAQLKHGDIAINAPFSICIAQSKIDYWIPIDVEKYKGEKVSIIFDDIRKDNIGYLQIKQSDDFHFDYNEKYRPNYHFSPRYGWTNDPNGMVYYEGEYHLFYQHNPYGAIWGNMSWGHTVSKDLKKWEHLPVAISPDSLGAIFSGSIVIDKENTAGFGKNAMIAIYTSAGDTQTQSIAYSLDKGHTFTKYDKNPVLINADYPDFRDPKVFWYEATKQWIMSLATGQTISFYSSSNLKEWFNLSEFGNGIGDHGGVWECPDLFPLTYNGQTKWVLLVSINPGGPNGGSGTQYFIGDFDGKTFKEDNIPYPLWIDYGRDNYAGVTWDNVPNGRRLFIGWMSNWDYANQTPSINFKNAMTLPRELNLSSNGKHLIVINNPVREIDNLRSETKKIGNIQVIKEHIISNLLDNSDGAYEIEMTLLPNRSSDFSFFLTNRKGEKLSFMFNINDGKLSIDRTKNESPDFNGKFANPTIVAPLKKVDSYKLRLFIDKASSELFINNGEVVMTNTIFPSEPYNILHFNCENGSLTIKDFNLYNLK